MERRLNWWFPKLPKNKCQFHCNYQAINWLVFECDSSKIVRKSARETTLSTLDNANVQDGCYVLT